MAGAATLAFTDSNFESEVLQSSVPVVVDFWAEWCGPCRMLGPVMDQLATDFSGRVKVGKLNIDNAPTIAAKYGVQSIPTVLIFQNGQPTERVVGAYPKGHYEKLLTAHAAGKTSGSM
ncbi:MAG: thioredoxin [Phycisphaerae bacterium]|nr:thioredoxin [Phycisphaerae bacterium]